MTTANTANTSNTNIPYSRDLRELYTDEPLSDDTPIYILCTAHTDIRRPSMRVYPNGAYCFTCGMYLSRATLLAKYAEEHPEGITAAKLGARERFTRSARPQLRQEEMVTLAELAHRSLTREHYDYFGSRGLPPSSVDLWKLGHYGQGYTIPVFDTEGRIVSLRFRRDDVLIERQHLSVEMEREQLPATPKYWGLKGFNQDRLYPFPAPSSLEEEEAHEPCLVLVEGEFEALLLRQWGLPAYSLTNGAGAWKHLESKGLLETLLPRSHRILVALDWDVAGQVATQGLVAALRARDYSANSLTVRYAAAPERSIKDYTELYQRSQLQFHEAVKQLDDALWERRQRDVTLSFTDGK